jgi:chromate transporter
MEGRVPDQTTARAQVISCPALFLAFLKVGLMGFGGAAPWSRRILVEERGWLDEKDYAELLGVASLLPGANTVNVALMFGDRCQGTLGALAGIVGLLAAPLVILVLLATLYESFAGSPDVQGAVGGAAAAAAGLVIGTAAKMTRNLKPGAVGLVIEALAFLAAGIFRLPLLITLLVLVPLSMLAHRFARRCA